MPHSLWSSESQALLAGAGRTSTARAAPTSHGDDTHILFSFSSSNSRRQAQISATWRSTHPTAPCRHRQRSPERRLVSAIPHHQSFTKLCRTARGARRAWRCSLALVVLQLLGPRPQVIETILTYCSLSPLRTAAGRHKLARRGAVLIQQRCIDAFSIAQNVI